MRNLLPASPAFSTLSSGAELDRGFAVAGTPIQTTVAASRTSVLRVINLRKCHAPSKSSRIREVVRDDAAVRPHAGCGRDAQKAVGVVGGAATGVVGHAAAVVTEGGGRRAAAGTEVRLDVVLQGCGRLLRGIGS